MKWGSSLALLLLSQRRGPGECAQAKVAVIGSRCSTGGPGAAPVEGRLPTPASGLNRAECAWKASIKERIEVAGVALCSGRRTGLRPALGLGQLFPCWRHGLGSSPDRSGPNHSFCSQRDWCQGAHDFPKATQRGLGAKLIPASRQRHLYLRTGSVPPPDL